MNEKAVTFGPGGLLSGILCEPARGLEVPGAPAVLMWNVGMNHRVGPWRINVDLARSLARLGIASLRFDVCGMGDSEMRSDTRADHERAVADVGEAIDFLEKRRVAQAFVLVGFCSSVDAGHIVALEDPRVAGMVYLEGYSFRTRGFMVRYPLRVVEPARVKRLLKLRFPRLFGRELVGAATKPSVATVFTREYPKPLKLRVDYERMVARGQKLLFVYVGGDTDFNHREQFFEMLESRTLEGRVDLEYYGEMDHTFFRVADRARVVERVSTWVRATFRARVEAPPVRAEV